MSNRDNFSSRTRENLGAYVNYRCAAPWCGLNTRAPSADFTRIVNSGVAAHITAAAENGPRYDSQLSSDQRRAEANGVHLCCRCATIVDVEPLAFPVEMLKEWQQRAVETARVQYLQTPRTGTANIAETNRQVEAFIKKCSQVQLQVNTWFPAGINISESSFKPVFELLNECWYYSENGGGVPNPQWTAGKLYHAQESYAYQIQISALGALARAVCAIRRSDMGWYRDDYGSYRLVGVTPWSFPLPGTQEHNQMMQVANMALHRLNLFGQAVLSLGQYVSQENTRVTF